MSVFANGLGIGIRDYNTKAPAASASKTMNRFKLGSERVSSNEFNVDSESAISHLGVDVLST